MEQAITSENKPERDEKGRLLPGNTANPNGRPKGSLSITALVKAELEKVPEGQQITYAQAFIKKLLHKAIIEGDTQTQKIIWNYIDGMPQQFMDHTTNGKELPTPIMALERNVPTNNSDEKDS